MKNLIRIIAFLWFFYGSAVWAREVSVAITEPGKGMYQIEGILKVTATSRVAWEVLTDYDNMSTFLSSMTHSKIRKREGHTLLLEQSAVGGVLVFKKKMLVLLKVKEIPLKEIDFEDISHQDFEFYEGSWQLEQNPEALIIRYEVTAKPQSSTPRLFTRGAFLKTARKLLKEVRTEILKKGDV